MGMWWRGSLFDAYSFRSSLRESYGNGVVVAQKCERIECHRISHLKQRRIGGVAIQTLMCTFEWL